MWRRKSEVVVPLLQGLPASQIGIHLGSLVPEWASPHSEFAAVRGVPAGPLALACRWSLGYTACPRARVSREHSFGVLNALHLWAGSFRVRREAEGNPRERGDAHGSEVAS